MAPLPCSLLQPNLKQSTRFTPHQGRRLLALLLPVERFCVADELAVSSSTTHLRLWKAAKQVSSKGMLHSLLASLAPQRGASSANLPAQQDYKDYTRFLLSQSWHIGCPASEHIRYQMDMDNIKRQVEDLLIEYGTNNTTDEKDVGKLLRFVRHSMIDVTDLQMAVRLGATGMMLSFLNEIAQQGAVSVGGSRGTTGLEERGNGREQLRQHLLQEQLEAIPDLQALQQLFSTEGNHKVPVSHACNNDMCSSAAAQMLVGVPESRLTYSTNFLVASLHAPDSNAAETVSSALIQSFITNLFALFRECWPHGLSFAYEQLHNQVESSTTMPCRIKNTRLDTMIVSTERRIAVFFGEDKRAGGLEAVKADLMRKLLMLPLTYLGHETLRYHLAYTIEGKMVRLHAATFIKHQNNVQVQLLDLGRACDLSAPDGRALLIIYLAKVYTVLECIVRCLPTCKATFPHGRTVRNESEHGWQSTLRFGLSLVEKTITGFREYCAYFHTSKSVIDKAYKAASDALGALPDGARPYMVPGTVSTKRARKDILSTTMLVVGMQQAAETEEEVQDLAAACCLTAKLLHSNRLVYKDWRSQNLVRHVDTKEHMVVDLESVSAEPTRIAPKHVLPSWGAHALQEQYFTSASDMYQIGLLINGILQHLKDSNINVSREAHAWVERLTCKDPVARLSAEDALRHAWLAGTKRRRLCEQAH